MRTNCPQCQAVVVQKKNRDGPNFCPNCRRLFYACNDRTVPTWILGILVILLANLQMMSQ
jgi:hypothetical protein